MAKANVFVLIEASSVCEGERRLGDVFIGTNVWWAESEFLLLCHFFISLVIIFMSLCIVLGTFSTSGEEIICIACLWTCGKSMY